MTTHKDPEGRPTVFDKLPPGLPRVVSVGRLDLGSEGCCCSPMTASWRGAWNLPSNGWIRRYRVRVFGHSREETLRRLSEGVTIEGVRYAGIEAATDSRKGDNAWLTVALQEGKNREIRRVMGYLGLEVSRLLRVAYGPFQLGQLPKGAVEEVNPKVLRDQLGLAAPKRPSYK
jgi:23S rRNA pseudouridine2605 synthase